MLAKLFQQHHLKIFFSNKFVHTSVLDKVKASAQISVSSNSKLFQDVLGEFAPKNDLKACLLAGSLLAKRCRQAKASLIVGCEPLAYSNADHCWNKVEALSFAGSWDSPPAACLRPQTGKLWPCSLLLPFAEHVKPLYCQRHARSPIDYAGSAHRWGSCTGTATSPRSPSRRTTPRRLKPSGRLWLETPPSLVARYAI